MVNIINSMMKLHKVKKYVYCKQYNGIQKIDVLLYPGMCSDMDYIPYLKIFLNGVSSYQSI